MLSLQSRTGAKSHYPPGAWCLYRIWFAFTTCVIISTGWKVSWLYINSQVIAESSHMSSNWPFNWIFPRGASHCDTQIVIKARNSARGDGWLLTAGFRNSAEPSHCCWQEISARRSCAEQELIWSGLLQLKGTGPGVTLYGESGDNSPHSFLQFFPVNLFFGKYWRTVFRLLLLIACSVWNESVNTFISPRPLPDQSQSKLSLLK